MVWSLCSPQSYMKEDEMPRPLSKKILASTGGEMEAIREHILDSALRVIQSDGLAGASTRVIATEAEIAAGTLYNYFDDRLQLLAQAILRRIQVLSQPVADLTLQAGKGSVAGNLRDVVRQAGNILDEVVPLIGAAFSDTELLGALQEETTKTHISFNPVYLVERYLLAERELGRISLQADCHAAASTIISVCHDRAFQRYLHGGVGEVESMWQEIDFIAGAIVPLERNEGKDS